MSITAYEANCKTDPNHVATPRYVVEQIYDLIRIDRFKNIWFPFNNYDSQFKLKADELNLRYKATHIFDDVGNDFFTTTPPENCELMISNPPFGIQNDIIRHSFKLAEEGLIKSFALLLPLSTLETETRANMYDAHKNDLSVIIFKKRIKFLGKSNSFNRGCCWVCYNITDIPTISWI
ncbi:sugar-phosphate nucleotidyltransferase [Ureibacillus sp. FSL E2-3493]|uniref:sugar-phosphate nucleotidyltransferase n=1 Tax=Ureibacillus sp. FSL E2-3493 TaxID=2921367 RepID=UPI0031199C5B